MEWPVVPMPATTTVPWPDALAHRDGDARSVGVGGADAAAVVDDDQVAVAAAPAGDDDRAGGGRARSGVPLPPAMSMPSCMRPQRGPKPEVIGPLTGHTSPAAARDRRRWTARRRALGRADLVRPARPSARAARWPRPRCRSRSPATRDSSAAAARRDQPACLRADPESACAIASAAATGRAARTDDVGAHLGDRVAGRARRRRDLASRRAGGRGWRCARRFWPRPRRRSGSPTRPARSTGSGSPARTSRRRGPARLAGLSRPRPRSAGAARLERGA